MSPVSRRPDLYDTNTCLSMSHDTFILTAVREKENFKEHWELRHCRTKNRESKATREFA